MDLAPIAPALLWRANAEPLAVSGWAGALDAAAAGSTYLARLCEREPELLRDIAANGPKSGFEAALALADSAGGESLDAAMRTLRIAKRRAHLAIAIGDLSGAWTLDDVTESLSALADVAVASALRVSAALMIERGEMRPVPPSDANGPVPGLALIAMGKLGARELNYSSDIDFSVFFDADRIPTATGDAKRLAVRIAQTLVRVLEEATADGYVFRTDLRLRPDPGSTAIAVSLSAAENYYQSLGQNWERAAFIKARPLGADRVAAEAFLTSLTPFIWRRHLDYAAIADVRSIKRQILSVHKGADIESGVFDVKLGRGGIRDIELFAQTQQLILGGRDTTLRRRRTLLALDGLAEAGRLGRAEQQALAEAYIFYRHVEHRIQMLADEQTHRPPAEPQARERLAALCGFSGFAALDAQLLARRRRVAEIDAALFGEDDSLADPLGPLVFTGVEDHPETLETLRKLGYANPSAVSAAVRGWHHGRVRAMRTERARELLTALIPRLLRALAESGDPDGAFARFADFMAALPSGVQLFSLFQAQPEILTALADVMGLAPALAETLAQRPGLFDALVTEDFVRPLAADTAGARRAALRAVIGEAQDFEAAINAARRLQREEALRIGIQTLQRRVTAADAGAAYADLAEACVAELAGVCLREVERLHGAAPGAFAVMALGKFGGGELAARSDLDMTLVYNAPADARSAGGRPLGPGEFFAKLTQRLVSALSAPTEEGRLYEVDMQLRPSGSQGPVAVRFSGFGRYYAEQAWTWELLALTRARCVAGDPSLCEALDSVVSETIGARRDRTKILADAAAMRARMDKDRPGRGRWDLKLAPGGLVDIEFIAQALILTTPGKWPARARANTGAALKALSAAGALSAADCASLHFAWTLYSDLNQIMQICLRSGAVDLTGAPDKLQALLADTVGAGDSAALETLLDDTQRTTRETFLRLIAA